MADQVLAGLTKAAKGILFPSETDAPFEPFVWEAAANTAASVRRLAGLPASAKCTKLSLDEFFADLLEQKEFAELRAAIDKLLTDVTVYRFGSIRVTYYVVGTAAA